MATLRVRDRRQSGLIERALLDVPEIECPIRLERAADAGAELRLAHRQLGARQRVLCVQRIVAHVVVDRAAQGVGAALGHDVDVAAERAAELGLRAGRDDLELLDRVDAVGDAAQPRRIVVGRQAVDDEVVRQVALAADRDA